MPLRLKPHYKSLIVELIATILEYFSLGFAFIEAMWAAEEENFTSIHERKSILLEDIKRKDSACGALQIVFDSLEEGITDATHKQSVGKISEVVDTAQVIQYSH